MDTNDNFNNDFFNIIDCYDIQLKNCCQQAVTFTGADDADTKNITNLVSA